MSETNGQWRPWTEQEMAASSEAIHRVFLADAGPKTLDELSTLLDQEAGFSREAVVAGIWVLVTDGVIEFTRDLNLRRKVAS